jgi:hypothetical protein
MHVCRGMAACRTLRMQNSRGNKGNAWGQQWHTSNFLSLIVRNGKRIAKCTYVGVSDLRARYVCKIAEATRAMPGGNNGIIVLLSLVTLKYIHSPLNARTHVCNICPPPDLSLRLVH